MRSYWLASLLFVLFVTGCNAENNPFFPAANHASERENNRITGMVNYVSDGDTIWITVPVQNEQNGQTHEKIKVRMLDIDAPEICQEGGKEARQALMHKLLRKSVQIENNALQDDFGRRLSRVYLGTEDIGAWMVSQGYAWVYHRPWTDAYYTLQENAQKQNLGIWVNPSPIKPQDFRRINGSCY